MKLKLIIVLFTLLSLQGYSQLRIVCIGNSISQGNSAPRFDGSHEYSYRPWLWDKLSSVGFDVDMVGYNPYFFNESAGNMTLDFPSSSGKPFDRNSEAYYGITSTGFLNGDPSSGWTGAALPKFADRINDPAKGYTPDIALMHIGTNDQDSTAALVGITKDNIRGIITVLRAKNPNVVVFLAKLITGWKKINPEIDGLCAELTTVQSPVIAVDINTGFINDPGLPGTMTYDWVHPNDIGQKFMMKKWYAAITTNLNDKIKPVLENKLSVNAIGETTVDLEWIAGSDNYGIKSYTLFANGKPAGILTYDKATYSVSKLSPGTFYTFKLVAKDWDNNVSDTAVVTATTMGVTGVDTKQHLAGVEIFPSVSTGIITMKGVTNTSVKVLNYIGKPAFSLESINADQIDVDLSNLPNGFYMVLIQKADMFTSRKILISK